MGIKQLSTLLMMLFVVSCTQGHCRRQADVPETAPPSDAPTVPAKSTAQKNIDHVFVYKYDGSMQCGMGQPVAPEAMAKELKGIPIVSSTKKTDGLMHIQVCGSLTGMANVYEISTHHLKQAEKKGFKKWSFE